MTDSEKLARAIPLLKLLARVAYWVPEGTEDEVYLGTQLNGIDNDVTPTIGECRNAAAFLEEIGQGTNPFKDCES